MEKNSHSFYYWPYFTFVASITALVIYKLYKWNSKKTNLLQEFQSSDAELIKNKKVNIKLEVSFTELTKYAFGKDPFKMTEVGFESCDIIKIEDAIVIFGKGYNSVIPKGKLVSEPFEINYKNTFRTDLNKAYLLNQEVQNENTCFELKVLGPWGEYTFEMIIYDYVLEKAEDNSA